MLKGFYNLTSGMLTQQRNLNVVANNLVNISTAGFKQDRYTSSTFDDVMFSRVGNKDKSGREDIGRISYIRASSQIYTSYEQGVPEPTNIKLDFAIEGDGFFAIQREDGIAYTRMGSFSLDDEGYLYLNGQGRVLDNEGQPIQLNTDKITGDEQGRIFTENGEYLGRLGIYAFEDNGALTHDQQGMFTGGGQPEVTNDVRVLWGYLERSNVDMVQQMTEMLTSQRALQSAAQVTRMYDTLMTKASTDLGRL